MKNREKAKGNLAVKFGIVVTAGIGVVSAIVIAALRRVNTKSGKKGYENMKDKVEKRVDIIKENVEKKEEAVKDLTDYVVKKVENSIKDNQETTEGIKNNIKVGYHKISKDIHKTAEKTSKDLQD